MITFAAPFALGTQTVPASPSRLDLTSIIPAQTNPNQAFVLIVFGDQAEALEFYDAASGGQPVDIAPATTRAEIGPYSAAVFPAFIEGTAGTTVTLSLAVLN